MEEYKKCDKSIIGVKAYNLKKLEENNINVPEWFVIPIDMLEDFNETNKEKILNYIKEKFSDTTTFSVRSSSTSEDSEDLSYAGQFDTFLNISQDEIISYIQKCLESLKSNNLETYSNKQKEYKMGIIIQEMIQPEKSGVLFTSNPNGLLNESVIVCGSGIGENVVDNKVDVTTYYYNQNDKIYYYDKQENAQELNKSEVEALIKIANQIYNIWNKPQDIEWCIENDNIYILQSRPITTIDLNKQSIILDNSNIVESYPGTTLPLSISFVKEAYYRIFKNVLIRLTSNNKIVEEYDDVLQNMVASANGRLYYRISNWYDIISFLPFKSKIIPIWQEMMGVSEKKVTTEEKKRVGILVRTKVLLNTINLLMTSPKKMKDLEIYFKNINKLYKEKYSNDLNNTELLKLYTEISEKLIAKWDITLVNDMYAFIYTGLLKHKLKKKLEDDIQINQYISNISNLESMKPIQELVKISQYVSNNEMFEDLEQINSQEKYELYVKDNKDTELCKMIEEYIEQYGDRNLEELKLESKTFRTTPTLLIRKILEYAHDSNINKLLANTKNSTTKIDNNRMIKFYAKRASIGIKNREKSRLNRCRIYGMIREIFLKIGDNLYKEHKIEEIEDIFYLTYDEIMNIVTKNEALSQNTIEERKEKYKKYNKLPAYSRLIYNGEIVEQNLNSIEVEKNEYNSNTLYGVPCSEGNVEGEVLVIENVNHDIDISGKILVTKMTDPGWVFLIARAKGIISEKGSLLSHTAIISRELKKPTIVGVKNATKILKTGDYIRIDGKTGKIEITRKELENV